MATKDGKKTGGRKKGSINKATADIKALAQVHGKLAIQKLVGIIKNPDNQQVLISAIKELIDRGYGKSKQLTEYTGKDGEPIQTETSLSPESKELLQDLLKNASSCP